jgi:hypothetical protein
MQHGSLFQELRVNRQFFVFANNLQTTVSYLSAMFQQQLSQCIILRIILFDY